MHTLDIPEPGTYLAEIAWRDSPAVYLKVHGIAACGGPHIDVTFDVTGKKPVRRTVRIAVDGSWRDVATLLPLNSWGEVFE